MPVGKEEITRENFYEKFDEFLDDLIKTELRKPLPTLHNEIIEEVSDSLYVLAEIQNHKICN
jgi:hypothetical protein